MRAYSLLLIKTCHRRGIHAMGGMAAQIPVKNNPQANVAALTKVRAQFLFPTLPVDTPADTLAPLGDHSKVSCYACST